MKSSLKYLLLLMLLLPVFLFSQEESVFSESSEKWKGKLAEELSYLLIKSSAVFETPLQTKYSGISSFSGLDIEMIKEKFKDYHRGDWDSWISKYEPSAKIYYNTQNRSKSPKEAAEMHESSVSPLSHYQFDPETVLIEKIDLGPNRSKVFFRGYWKASFKGSELDFVIPTQVSYYITNGRITEEFGFWDNTIAQKAHEEMLKKNNKQ